MKRLTTGASGMAIAVGVLVAGHDAYATNGYPNLYAAAGPTGSGEIQFFGCGYTPGGSVFIDVTNQFSESQGSLIDVAASSGLFVGCVSGVIENLGCGYQATVSAEDLTTGLPSIPDAHVTLDCIQ